MTSVPVEDELSAANRGAISQTLWQRIARAFDNYVTRRRREAVPATVLCRSRRDHDRCRRLILRGSISSRSGRGFDRVKHDHEWKAKRGQRRLAPFQSR